MAIRHLNTTSQSWKGKEVWSLSFHLWEVVFKCSNHQEVLYNRGDHTSSSFQLWEVVLKCPYRQEVYSKYPKRKGNVSIKKGIRSKVKCRSSAHLIPIWGGGCTGQNEFERCSDIEMHMKNVAKETPSYYLLRGLLVV